MNAAEESIAFYMEIGIAITQWAQVEVTLIQLLLNGFPEDQRDAIYTGYANIDGFGTKLGFASGVIGKHFTGKHLEDWSAIEEKLRNLVRGRNKLAHWRVHGWAGAAPGKNRALIPWKVTSTQLPKMYLQDINGLRFEFSAVNVRMMNLLARIQGRPDNIDKASETPMKRLTLNQLRQGVTLHSPVRLAPKTKREKKKKKKKK